MTNQNGNLQQMPSNLEAEQSLIGSILINPQMYALIDLSADEFYVARHAWIWSAVERLTSGGLDVDIMTVTDSLEKAGHLGEIGGPAFLTQLLNTTPTSLHAESYAKIVRDTANRRRLLLIANKIAKKAYDTEKEIDLSEIALSLSRSVKHNQATVSIGESAEIFYTEVVDRMNNPGDTYSIPTNFMDFDKITGGGLYPSQGLLVAAPPKVGKSMFVMQMAEQIARHHDVPGAIYSMEMKNRYFFARRTSALSKVGNDKIISGRMDTDEFNEFETALDSMRTLPIYMSDGAWTLNSLRADLTRLKVEHGIKWFVLDYLGKIRLPNADSMNKWDAIDIKSNGVIEIINDLDLAGVVIHTMLKSGQSKDVPVLTDLHGSDLIYDFDTFVFMKQDEKEDNLVHFYTEASRHHLSKGMFTMVRSPHYPVFQDAVREDMAIPSELEYEPTMPYKD